MKTNFKKKLKRGLTLVELSVVVLILGLIITIVAINIKPDDIKCQLVKTQVLKDAQAIQAALEQYQTEYGKIPTDEQGLQALVEKPTTGDAPDNFKPMLKSKKAILDPWKTPYKLRTDSGDYAIVSLGADGKEGGDGKNTDFNILKEDEFPDFCAKKK